jgi:hypothetical protein
MLPPLLLSPEVGAAFTLRPFHANYLGGPNSVLDQVANLIFRHRGKVSSKQYLKTER